MIFGYFTLFVALVISTVAAYYSIVGLTAIFSAAVIPILIMGASLEVGKVTAAVWLKLNWERAGFLYKFYLVPAVAFLMLLTSMGIFGFLSKAHSDQSLVSGDSMAKVAIYDEKINTAKDNIATNRKALKQMDEAVDQVMGRSDDEKGADKAVAIRRSQTKERARLLAEIEVEQKRVSQLSEERAPFAAEFRKVESEVGPIKYIAALVYGDNPDQSILEKAVRLVIIIIVAVFDPLALVLIIAAQQSIRWAREEREKVREEDRSVEITKDTQAEEIQTSEGEPELSIFERHPYLLKPFAHFKNLWPMPSKSEHTIMDDVAAMSIVPPKEEETRPFTEQEIAALDATPRPISDYPELQALVKKGLADGSLVIQGNVEPDLHVYDDERLVSNHDKKILAMGVDVVDRPGDYVTPPEPVEPPAPVVQRVPEAAPAPNRGVMNSHLAAQADNGPDLGTPINTSFGNEYPVNPNKGDLYLRTDFLPNRLFKYNGTKWIEVDKNQTDVYAYEEQYIKHLVDEIGAGRYDPDTLTDVEREQIQQYLSKNAL